MSFRARLALVAAAAVALAVVLASVTTYVVVRDQLRDTVDDALQERADEISTSANRRRLSSVPGRRSARQAATRSSSGRRR